MPTSAGPVNRKGPHLARWLSGTAIQERRDRGLPLHYSAVVVHDELLAGAARRWFGSRNAALKAAGVATGRRTVHW